MNLLQLESSPGWGGQEIRILREAIGLRDRGHNVFFVVQKGGKLALHAAKEGFFVKEVGYKKAKSLLLFWQIRNIIRGKGIQVINTHSSLDSWIGGLVARYCKIAVVRTRHLSTAIRKGLNSRILYHTLADFVVTTCQEVVPTIISQAKKPAKEVVSIPTGVNWEEVTFDKEEASCFRQLWQVRPSQFLIGMVCFMRSWKGVDDFIQAAYLSQENPELQWVIIGGGHAKTYQDMAKKLSLKNLRFAGHLDKPFSAIAALDAFCLLSTNHEGVSQASLQAAFLQKPLITTPTGGLKEVCLPGKTGCLVPCHSPQEVVSAATYLQKNPEVCLRMGQAGKLLVTDTFSWKRTLDSMEELYTGLMANR